MMLNKLFIPISQVNFVWSPSFSKIKLFRAGEMAEFLGIPVALVENAGLSSQNPDGGS